MRILHVLDHSAPLHSGYTFRTLSIMREQQRRGWTPLLLTGPKQGSGRRMEEDADGWHFFRTSDVTGAVMRWPIAREFAQMRALQKRLLAVAQQTRPDIIHAHSPVLNGLPALRVARRLHLPLVYEVRAFWEDAAVEHGTSQEGSARYRATRAAETYVLRRADAVTTICQGLREAIVDRGVDSDHVTVIPNAVNIEQFTSEPPNDQQLRDSLDLQDCLVLGFAGSFYRYEGLDILIHALQIMQGWTPPVRLLLVGGGPEADRLKALAEELGVSDMIRFVGRVPHADMPRYYGLIDALVYPRLRHRLTELVTPLKPLEAMAQKKLVVASDVGGHRELITADKTGFLFTPESSHALADCIDRMRGTAAETLETMRDNGRAFVERERSWPQSVECYDAVYKQLVADADATTARGDLR